MGQLSTQELLQAAAGESTASMARRSQAAHALALARQGCTNAQLQGQAIDAHTPLSPAAQALLHKAAARLGWSGRGVHRTLKVARTIADLAGSAHIEAAHLAEAVQYRRVLKEA